MALTNAQMSEAIAQMICHCKLQEETDYELCHARAVLYTLGYEADADQILQRIYDGGFTHCLDRDFPNKDGVRPSDDSCYWGPDQLRSRLKSLYWHGE